MAAEGKVGMLPQRKGGAAGMDSGVARRLLGLQIVVVSQPIKVGREVLRAERGGAYDRRELEQAMLGWADRGRGTTGEAQSI